jgi:hypothetical protein
MFLRNVGSYKKYTASSYSKRQNSSTIRVVQDSYCGLRPAVETVWLLPYKRTARVQDSRGPGNCLVLSVQEDSQSSRPSGPGNCMILSVQ